MDFRSLDLRIRSLAEEDSSTALIEAAGPSGEWCEATTQLPLALLNEMGTDLYQLDLKEMGERLGDSLMPQPVLQLYRDLLPAPTEPGLGLRLALNFLGAARAYGRLPWEAIRIQGREIAASPQEAVVRTIDLPEPAIPLGVEKPPYRVLVCTSNPEDTSPLESEKEGMLIREALEPLIQTGLIHMEVHHNLMIGQVERLLHDEEFHILHFSGYSNFDPDGNGVLYFVDEAGKAEPLDGQALGSVLRASGVRLAVLNTGHGVVGEGGVGLAEGLLRAGLPVVVGHNYMIADQSSVDFASAFYRELAHTNTVERAVYAGRRAIAASSNESLRLDRFNPVLYSRTGDGRLWTGEAGTKIETFIREGRLVTEAAPRGQIDATAFANRIDEALAALQQVQDADEQLRARSLIAEAKDAIEAGQPDLASQKLSEASTEIQLKVADRRLWADRKRAQLDRRARWTVLLLAVGLLVTVALLAFLLRDAWTPETTIPVIDLPISVVVWSFIGGVAAMLQAFVGTKKSESTPSLNYEWLLWRPVVGVIMGSVVYLAIAGGLLVLGQGGGQALTESPNFYFLWAISFIGGFSDRFAVFVFDSVVRRVPGSGKEGSPENGSSDSQAA